MSLRNKLLLLALSTLILPFAGWQLVRQLEGLLREGQGQAQLASAEALARALVADATDLPPAGPAFHVQQARQPLTLDGYDEDWRAQGIDLQSTPGGLQVGLAQHGDSLYLFAALEDASRVRADAHWPQAAHADQLHLVLEDPNGARRELRVASAAPGPAIVAALDPAQETPRLLGEWQEDARGWRVELRFPRGLWPLRLGIFALDFADPASEPRRAGPRADPAQAGWTLLRPSPGLQRRLTLLAPEGTRVRLLHPEGWVLARAGEFGSAARAATVPWWRRVLYRVLSRGAAPAPPEDARAPRLQSEEVWQALSDKPASAWRELDQGRLLLSTAVPVRVNEQTRGALLLERPSEALLLTDQALTGLMLATLAAMGVIGAGLLGFASRLSSRIRRLSLAAEQAMARDGAAADFPRSGARDELGDLSRSFARLLEEVAAYTDYLRSLAGKLSHELHTPLAVVRSSLENLESQPLPRDATTYVQRARAGVDRLGAIVRAMSEASRMERAIAAAEAEDFDLRALVEACAEGYRPLLAPRDLKLMLPAQSLRFHGAPDLISQALDKLVDNARSFCPENGWVLLALASGPDGVELAVANSGPLLPAAMQERVFDSLVSLRDKAQRGDGAPHLGLGLSIVRLIAEWHRGSARARNLPGGDGVEFRLSLRGSGALTPRLAGESLDA